MRTNKADINFLRCENHNGNQPVVISLNVEYKPIVSNIICRVECAAYFVLVICLG